MPPLFFLFLIPFLIAFALFSLSFVSSEKLKPLAIGCGLIPLVYLIAGGTEWIGSEINWVWFSDLSINFHLKIDSLSLLFLFLTALIVPIAFFAAPSELAKAPLFYGLTFLLQGLLFGLFTARDLAFFTFFWEATLLPLYFMISLWGGPLRQRAATKFIIYMIAGSTLMIVAVLFLYFGAGHTFDLDQLASIAASTPYASWICLIFLIAFAVKTPLFPFHAWLPDTYYQASTTGTILLSALLSKAGIYGLLRINYRLFPSLMVEWSPYLIGLAVVGVIYGAFCAWMQSDFKRLIAYSSFSHVNFILAGVFVFTTISYQGAVLQAFNHGVTIAGLFLVAGWLTDKIGTTSIGLYEGVAKYFPKLCWLTFIFVLSSVALPGTNNFVGEIIILFALFGKHPWLTVILALSVILSVVYMLRWMQSLYFGKPTVMNTHPKDIGWGHVFQALPLIFLIFWIGIYPSLVLNEIKPVDTILEQKQ